MNNEKEAMDKAAQDAANIYSPYGNGGIGMAAEYGWRLAKDYYTRHDAGRAWHRIEDGLPDSDGFYLWSDRVGTVYILRFLIEVTGEGWLVSSEPQLKDLAAWMPIPEPFDPQETK